jgi:hypothetical protein
MDPSTKHHHQPITRSSPSSVSTLAILTVSSILLSHWAIFRPKTFAQVWPVLILVVGVACASFSWAIIVSDSIPTPYLVRRPNIIRAERSLTLCRTKSSTSHKRRNTVKESFGNGMTRLLRRQACTSLCLPLNASADDDQQLSRVGCSSSDAEIRE